MCAVQRIFAQFAPKQTDKNIAFAKTSLGKMAPAGHFESRNISGKCLKCLKFKVSCL
jgi:hypothetical protein